MSTLCTVCGSTRARACNRCHSAAYCSVECQQTDWRTHQLLCRRFADITKDGCRARPSPNHYLVIYFPEQARRPILKWVGCRKTKEDHFLPDLAGLLVSSKPCDPLYLGHGLRQVRGNILRGRRENRDTLRIWFLEHELDPYYLPTNDTIHNPPASLIADTWGEFTWRGPVVAVLMAGSDFDPKCPTDITLTAYRDAIDYLGFYMDTVGSMIDQPGCEAHRAGVVLANKRRKCKGVRVNCFRDQLARDEPGMVHVSVPGMHPLFNTEGDDPCSIPSLLGLEWVIKAYDKDRRSAGDGDAGTPADPDTDADADADADRRNPLVDLLRLTLTTKDGRWIRYHSWSIRKSLGSHLLVDRNWREVAVEDVAAVCRIIKDVAIPFMDSCTTPDHDTGEALEDQILQEWKVYRDARMPSAR